MSHGDPTGLLIMSKRKPTIEPKPTQYGRTLFRSRLEARWAVFFDFCPGILNWEYEPKTFTLKRGWTYCPDFRVRIHPPQVCKPFKQEDLYVEIKPTTISDEYRHVLSCFAKECKITLFVIQGDFYYGFCPEASEEIGAAFASHIHLPGRLHSLPLNIFQVFGDARQAVYHAQHFRFDLKG